MKRLLSIVIMFLFMISSLGTTGYAAEIANSGENRVALNSVLADLREKYPDGMIMVKDGVIHVTSTGNADIGASVMTASNTNSNPRGGSWDNFHLPFLYWFDQSLERPHAIVFLPADLTQILVDSMHNEIIKTIIDQGYQDESGITAIREAIYIATGVYYSAAQITFLAIDVSVSVFKLLNYANLTDAQGSSGKVRIEFCTASGWPINHYMPWLDDDVDCSPWEDFDPDFNPEVYNLGVV